MKRSLLLYLFSFFISSVFAQSTGDIDSTFSDEGQANAPAGTFSTKKMLVQPDGKILLLGTKWSYDENYLILTVGRLLPNGNVDRSFGNKGLISDAAFKKDFDGSDIALLSDGSFLVSGDALEETPGPSLQILRYFKNGLRDYSFKIVDPLVYPSTHVMAVQNDGNIVIASEQAYGKLVISIYRQDGTKVSTSTTSYPSTDYETLSLSAYADGGFVLSYTTSGDKGILYSTKFGERIFKYKSLRHTLLSNGRVALIGFSHEQKQGSITMVNKDGNLDLGFGDGGYLIVPGVFPEQVTEERGGKIVVAIAEEQVSKRGFIRLTNTGRIDSSFGNHGFAQSEDYSNGLAVYGNRLYSLAFATVHAFLLNTHSRKINVNLHGNSNPYVSKEWNNWNNLKDRHFYNFYYSDSTYSTIDAVMSNRNGVNDNGSDYGSTRVLMAPKGVLRHSSYSTTPRTITLGGLVPSKTYDFELYASRSEHPGNSTSFTIDGVTRSVATYRNYGKKVIFNGVTPNQQGYIVIALKGTKDYNYLNGLVITEHFGGTSLPNETLNSAGPSEKITIDGAKHKEEVEMVGLQLTAFPNPSSSYFTIRVSSPRPGPVDLRLVDAVGRVVEQKQNVAPVSTITLGRNLKPGTYYLEGVQGRERQRVKLVKTPE